MKRIVSVFPLVLALLLASCGNKQNYTIVCQSESVPEGSQVLLYDMFGEKVVDSAVFSNGEATFKGYVEQPFVAFVFVGRNPLSMLMVEPGNIHYGIDSDTLYGTPMNDQMSAYIRELHTLQMELMNARENAKSRSFDQVMKEVSQRYAEMNWRYYHANEDNQVGAFMLLAMLNNRPNEILSYEQFDSVLATASPAIREFKAIKDEQERIAQIRKTAVGMPIVDFEGIDYATGKTTSLVKMTEGKLALVDFWASWCAPCRAVIKSKVIGLYEKYKDQNFVVVGVDIMDKEADHRKASEQLGIPYPQIIDNSEESIAAKAYNITSIPFIMLVAPDGTILAKNLTENDVEAAIVKALN